MAKIKTQYVCQECGSISPRWEGQCRGCQAWNTLVEEKIVKQKLEKQRGWSSQQGVTRTLNLGQKVESLPLHRLSTSIKEFDRVLGGGLVPGSYTLLGGDPGIGKSTLLLQMAGVVAETGQKVLYISGEESVEQSALRAQRLGVRSENLVVGAESQMEAVLALTESHQPKILVVDSIQTLYMQDLQSAPGSVAQVRECANVLMGLAKGKGISVFIVGHVTKDGHIAGPKVLEHMVDTVLSFEGDSNHQFRLLRALKNRFGPTNELGVFRMQSGGLEEVENPSEIFISERGSDVLGSSVYVAVEGTRPLLCEIQALTSDTPAAFPRRTSIGFDTNRVHLLVAVLSKHLDIDFGKSDVYVNVVGGLKINEPAADLAVASSLISTQCHIYTPPNSVFMGEIGLTGEVRGISFVEERVREAEKLGFTQVVLPASNKKHLHKMKTKAQLIYTQNAGDLFNILRHLAPNPKKPATSRQDRTFDQGL